MAIVVAPMVPPLLLTPHSLAATHCLLFVSSVQTETFSPRPSLRVPCPGHFLHLCPCPLPPPRACVSLCGPAALRSSAVEVIEECERAVRRLGTAELGQGPVARQTLEVQREVQVELTASGIEVGAGVRVGGGGMDRAGGWAGGC